MRNMRTLLLLALALLLCSLQIPAYAGAWPASREELPDGNMTSEESARLWAEKNYGEDAVILSVRRVATGKKRQLNYVYLSKLLDDARLDFSTWEIQLIPKSLSSDLEISDGALTVAIQVATLFRSSDAYNTRRFTLAGFLSPGEDFHDLHEVRAFLQEDPRFADSLAELHTVVPAGITEIDLREFLGNDVLDVVEAYALRANVFLILRRQRDYVNENYVFELISLDTQNGSILSRMSGISAKYYYRQGWEGNACYLLFEPVDAPRWYDPALTYMKITVTCDGTMEMTDAVPARCMVMPGGETIVRMAVDGSLYAVEAATGEEELLIQGVPYLGYLWDEGYTDEEIAAYFFPSYEEAYWDAVAAYEPCWDELPESWFDLNDGSIPFNVEDLGDEDSIRQFYVRKPLDEHRFVYAVYGHDLCNAGFGVYDLKTRTDHRITGRGDLHGVAGDTLFGSTMMADANTYETSPLPESVRELLAAYKESVYYDYDIDCDFSPNGKLLAQTGMKNRINYINDFREKYQLEPLYSEGNTVTVTDIRTGDILKAYDIHNPFATEHSVAFYDGTRCMLFFRPEDLGSAYMYLFDIED